MATQQIINIGASPNDGAGDPLRTAFQKTNENFSVLFGISGITGIANGTSNISIPLANSNIVMSVGNVANVFTVQANGTTTLGNHVVTSGMNAGNVTSSGTIIASGTIQSLGGITGVTISAASNLVGANLNVTNTIRTSDLLITGNITNADLNITGNIISRAITGQGNLIITGAANISGNTNVLGNTSSAFFIGNGSQLTGVTAAPANIFNIMSVSGSPLVVATSPNDTLFWTYGNNVIMTGNNSTRTINVQITTTPVFNTVTANAFIGDLKGSLFADDSTEIISAVDNRLTVATGVIGTLSVTGNTVLEGNLIVNGTTEYNNVNTLAIEDPIVIQGRNANNTPLISNDGKDRGQQYYYYSGSEKSAFIGYDNSAGNMISATDVTITNEIVTVNNFGTFQTGNIYAQSLNSTGAVNGATLSASGNVSGGNLNASGNISGGNLSISGNVSGGNLSLSGNVIGNLNLTANLNTAGISSTGNVNASYFIGNVVGNVTGNLVVAGSNTAVVFNDSGVANSTTGFTFNKTSNAVFVGNSISAVGNVTGNYILGNGALLTGVITSVANINNGTSNVTVVSSGGNITVGVGGTGNVAVFSTTGVEISGNVTGGNLISTTSGQISTNGNVTGGNVLTATLFTNIGGGGSAIQNGGANGGGNIGNATGHFNTAFVTAVLASGNVTGGNIVTAGQVTATANITGGNLITSGILTSTGNITGGNITTPGVLTVNSGGAATAIVNGGANATGNIGSSSSYFNQVFATATTALYADLAEKYLADADYEVGTVVSFGGGAEVTISNSPGDIKIAGVVSQEPAYKMNAGLQGEYAVYVALVGRVPVKVSGPVSPGDLMVSDGNGRAVASASPQLGSVIGKALGSNQDSDNVIEIVVGRL